MAGLHIEGRAERLARLGLHRHLSRVPKGGAAREDDIVAEIAALGVPPADAQRALQQLAQRGEIYLTRAGWRPRAIQPSPRSPLLSQP